ncbi:hypothetical protein Vadar_003052 [Vaccinium darrowii]|uniref:Uncharacterized protein n=1 Tax=Vaccinium darrowii TaxID=229202 RepID=A0ACB7YJ22_9ERIC|nr:hypothetical protein Vadar_003052 [Vaccinium darrowii]
MGVQVYFLGDYFQTDVWLAAVESICSDLFSSRRFPVTILSSAFDISHGVVVFGQQKPETCILGVITNLHHHRKNKIISLTPEPSDQLPSSAYTHHGPSISPLHSPSPSASRWSAPAHAPSPTTISSEFGMPISAPTVSPLSSSIIKKATPPPSPLMALPPPPPNEGTMHITVMHESVESHLHGLQVEREDRCFVTFCEDEGYVVRELVNILSFDS